MKSWMASTSVSRVGREACASSSTRSAPTRRRRKSASVRRCGSSSVSPSPDADDEVDERLVGAAPVDRQRRDARADDDREREEALADDLAERLEAADALADALEPAVGPNGVQREFFALFRQPLQRHRGSRTDASRTPWRGPSSHARRAPPSVGRRASRRSPRTARRLSGTGSAGACPMWQSEKSYLTGSSGSRRAERGRDLLGRLPGDVLSARSGRGSARACGCACRRGTRAHVAGTSQSPRSTPSAGRTIQRKKRRSRLEPPAPRGSGSKCAGPRRLRLGAAQAARRSNRAAQKRESASRNSPAAAKSAAKRAPSDPLSRCTRRAPMRRRATSSPRKTRCIQPRHPREDALRVVGGERGRGAEARERVRRACRGSSSRCQTRCDDATRRDELLVERVVVTVHEADRVAARFAPRRRSARARRRARGRWRSVGERDTRVTRSVPCAGGGRCRARAPAVARTRCPSSCTRPRRTQTCSSAPRAARSRCARRTGTRPRRVRRRARGRVDGGQVGRVREVFGGVGVRT